MAAARQYEMKVSMTDVATTMRTRFAVKPAGWEKDAIKRRAN